MPAIRDWTWNYNSVATGSTISAPLPAYQQNDLLLAIFSADTSAGTVTSSGWTQLFTLTNTSMLSVFWKIAGASETAPTFTGTTTESYDLYLISVQDVNTSTPFNGTGGAGTGYRTLTTAAARTALPQLTTTVNNSLIIYINIESGAVVPGVLEGPCTYEAASDGLAHSDGWSWGFMPTTGATPATVFGNKNGTAAGILATIGISPPAGGATVIPAYCAADNSIYIDPIHGTTAYNGNTAFAATATTNFGTTLNGRTLSNGTAAAAADVGLNSFHSMGQLTGVTTDGTYAGAALVLATANKPNVSGKNVICHIKPSTPKVYQNTDPMAKSTSKGVAFGMASTAASAYKWWHVHAAGTSWDSAAHIPIVINSSNTSGLLQTTGSLVDTSILAFGFAVSGFTVAPVFQFGSLWALDTTIVSGGNTSIPVNISGIAKVCATGKERMSVIQQGASQALIMQPIQFGNGGTNPIYLNLDSSAIEFPQQYDINSRQIFYCSSDNIAGLTYYAGSSDTIKHTNAVVSSKSKFHWKIHPSSSSSASYDFTGLAIIGAGTVQLANTVNISGITFNSCDQITAATSTITNCTFTKSTTSTGAISITGTTQTELQTALNKLVSCTWLNNTVGLRIIYTGTGNVSLNMSSGSFSGNTKDIRWEAGAGQTLTINKSGTCTVSTYETNNSTTVTIQVAVALTLTGLVSGSDIVILNAGTETERVNINANSGSTYIYSFSTPGDVDICVYKQGYIPFSQRNYTLPSQDGSLPIKQVQDRNFSNP